MTVPGWLTNLVDDAAIFPPGNAPLEEAARAHRKHRSAEYAPMVGSFVISDLRLPELIDVLDELDDDPAEPLSPFAVTVVVTGGAGGVEPAVRWAGGSPLMRLSGVEIALRDEDDLPGNARRVLAAVDAAGVDPDEVAVAVEPPRVPHGPGHGWLTALDELAMAGVRTKFRTGGADPDAFPGPGELAAGIAAALDRELPFKCTAGLHHAIGWHDPEIGADNHGFLNVLLATRRCLDGAEPADVEEVLRERSAEMLLGMVEAEELTRARRWFTSFGSCSMLEPHDDLVELGLITRG